MSDGIDGHYVRAAASIAGIDDHIARQEQANVRLGCERAMGLPCSILPRTLDRYLIRHGDLDIETVRCLLLYVVHHVEPLMLVVVRHIVAL